MVKTFGLKKIDDTDKRIVLECLDLDKDGKVGFDDLQNLLFQDLALLNQENEQEDNQNLE